MLGENLPSSFGGEPWGKNGLPTSQVSDSLHASMTFTGCRGSRACIFCQVVAPRAFTAVGWTFPSGHSAMYSQSSSAHIMESLLACTLSVEGAIELGSCLNIR